MTMVTFPCHPDSVTERPFIPEMYMERSGDGVEIGLLNRRGYAYAWTVITKAKLEAALALLNIEDVFDDG